MHMPQTPGRGLDDAGDADGSQIAFGALRDPHEKGNGRARRHKKAPDGAGAFRSLEELAKDQYFVEMGVPPQLKR